MTILWIQTIVHLCIAFFNSFSTHFLFSSCLTLVIMLSFSLSHMMLLTSSHIFSYLCKLADITVEKTSLIT
uniref:Uncharacterized protein n=1 Tax=Octopus bimaculoides TaxID=37653 RepID=A0A0L8H8P2_OCTBM